MADYPNTFTIDWYSSSVDFEESSAEKILFRKGGNRGMHVVIYSLLPILKELAEGKSRSVSLITANEYTRRLSKWGSFLIMSAA